VRTPLTAFLAIAGLALVIAAGADPRPTTLYNSGDPTLALTPGLRGATAAPKGAPAGNPDPHDLEGVWWLTGYEYLLGPEPGVAPPLKPDYLRILERRIRAKNRGVPEADASTQCLPHGMPRVMESPYPIEIVQTPGRITFLHEVAHNIRRIYLDQPHPKNLALTFLGHSVGHWEGDTLVVDTIGVVPQAYIAVSEAAGVPNNGDMHIIERIHLAAPDILHDDIEIIAPKVLTAPWKTTRIYFRQRARKFDIVEGVCIQGNYSERTDQDGNAVFVPIERQPWGNLVAPDAPKKTK
jgi:hypothetical protein